MILENIHSPYDVKQLTNAETRRLCDEVRAFMVRSVAETGGHLASNLGVVELTIAIHRVFDTYKTRRTCLIGKSFLYDENKLHTSLTLSADRVMIMAM